MRAGSVPAIDSRNHRIKESAMITESKNTPHVQSPIGETIP
jgi:hypothetical protein